MKPSGAISKWQAEKLGLLAAGLGLLLSAGVLGAENGPENAPMDWDRARELRQRELGGDKLAPDEQAYLDRAKALLQSGQGPNQGPAGPMIDGIDMQRARELFQKSQRGEELTPDEQGYLDKARAARRKADERGQLEAVASPATAPQSAASVLNVPAAASSNPSNPHVDAAWSRDDAAHLLRRAGFGGTPSQIDRLHALGPEAAVDYLLTGKRPEGLAAPFDPVNLPDLNIDLSLSFPIQGPMLQYKLQELRAWWLDRMVRTDRPLVEKMTLFWHGLFCSGVREVRSVQAMADQNRLFRREAIGNYKRLTAEIIHDPAMIVYLNNDQNIKGRPNENLARELMELFTMGEGNGYTEKDIPEVARALTGMTVDRFSETSRFVPFRHDAGLKTIFGKTGNFTPDDVPKLIFDRPEPAPYLAKRLWQFFGTPDPADEDIAPVAEALRAGGWELAPALRALFTSPAFYGDRCKFAVIKSPVELEAGTLRLLEEPPQPRMLWAASTSLQPMGEELFQPPNVKGWPGEDHWITSGTLSARYTIATAASTGRLGAGVGVGMRVGFGPLRANAQITPATQPAGAQAARPARPTRLTLVNPANPPTSPGQARSANTDPAATAAQTRQERAMELRQEQAQQVREEVAKMPPVPPADTLVVPAKLFAELGKEATPEQVVDAAAARFLQQPLAAGKKATLVESMGTQPVRLGQQSSDNRVRQMIGLMMSTSEYQVE